MKKSSIRMSRTIRSYVYCWSNNDLIAPIQTETGSHKTSNDPSFIKCIKIGFKNPDLKQMGNDLPFGEKKRLISRWYVEDFDWHDISIKCATMPIDTVYDQSNDIKSLKCILCINWQ
jgi:hypothetical protein